MTAQLVPDIAECFAPYEFVAEAYRRNHRNLKRADNVPLSCLDSRPSRGPSFPRIANLKSYTPLKGATQRRLIVYAGEKSTANLCGLFPFRKGFQQFRDQDFVFFVRTFYHAE